MSTRNARREFLRRASQTLALAGISSSFYDLFLGRVLQSAIAAEAGVVKTGFNYVHLSLPGGPPRWFFDLPLTPTGKTDKNFVAGGFGTLIDGGKAVYADSKVVTGKKTVYLPPVWNMGLANHRFTDLLPNTVFIRGLDMEINNHPLSNARQVAPIIGGYSIQGMLADASSQPIPSVVDTNSNAALSFRSKRGLANSALTFASGKNPVAELLKPFGEFRTGRSNHTAQRVRLQEQALAQIEAFGESRGVTANALPLMYENAIELIDQKITTAANGYAATVEKYRKIIDEAIRPNRGSLPGIYDKAVASAKTDAFNFVAGGVRVELDDIRDMMNPATTITRMAENFAVMEILLDTVTSTMTLGFPAFSNVTTSKNANGDPVLRAATHDQHDIGSTVSTMMTTLWYRAFLGCLTEFTSQLKARNAFDRTIIHISAEFNRTPKTGGGGSDHGFMAGNTTLITGMVKENVIMGNIKKDYNSTYRGTFGVASGFSIDGSSRPIQVNDVALTITSMLGIDSIVTNGRPLFKPEGDIWIPKKTEAENV